MSAIGIEFVQSRWIGSYFGFSDISRAANDRIGLAGRSTKKQRVPAPVLYGVVYLSIKISKWIGPKLEFEILELATSSGSLSRIPSI